MTHQKTLFRSFAEARRDPDVLVLRKTAWEVDGRLFTQENELAARTLFGGTFREWVALDHDTRGRALSRSASSSGNSATRHVSQA